MERGTVKWFDDAKGYGFALRQNGESAFFHHSDILQVGGGRRTALDGEEITFDIELTEKGPPARNITRLGLTEAAPQVPRPFKSAFGEQ